MIRESSPPGKRVGLQGLSFEYSALRMEEKEDIKQLMEFFKLIFPKLTNDERKELVKKYLEKKNGI